MKATNLNKFALICLAAGKSQLPVIEKAKSLGYTIVAIDRNREADGFKYADYKIYKSTYDADEIIKELDKFKDVKITARFQSVIVIVDPLEGSKNFFHGTWEGRITHNPRGKNGFGYDPLFYIESLESTAAELNQAEKNKLSHRARAMRKATNYLEKKTFKTE